MGNRLSKIYTRTGDDGSTGMADGSRVSKADNLFSVMGDIDELNSHIGLVRAQLQHNKGQSIEKEFSQALVIIQHLLFNIGGELAMPEYEGVNATHITWLEQQKILSGPQVRYWSANYTLHVRSVAVQSAKQCYYSKSVHKRFAVRP